MARWDGKWKEATSGCRGPRSHLYPSSSLSLSLRWLHSQIFSTSCLWFFLKLFMDGGFDFCRSTRHMIAWLSAIWGHWLWAKRTFQKALWHFLSAFSWARLIKSCLCTCVCRKGTGETSLKAASSSQQTLKFWYSSARSSKAPCVLGKWSKS